MAKDALTIDISPALREALQIRSKDAVDYFTLLGLNRGVADEKIIDTAILERSKSLRKWQTSPAYSAECVKLLAILHRAGKIVKDPARRAAYRQEIERAERGEKMDSREEFRDLVRAAMGDSALDALARRELMKFAAENNLSQADAQQIVAQVREEIGAARAAEAARQKDEEWEFRINEAGEEGFILMLDGMESSDLGELSPAELMKQAARFQVPAERAAQLIADFQKSRFKRMIKRVAASGVVSDAQARLLLPKAASYGLDQREAYDIIADYSLSARSTEEALKHLAFAQTFTDADIHNIVENRPVVQRRAGLLAMIPDWLRNLALIGGGCALLLVVGIYLKDNLPGRSGKAAPSAPAATPAPETAAATPAVPAAGAQPTPDAPVASASPTPGLPALEEKPDPPSGMLAFTPEKPGDPPAFEMAITEVTCAQYQEYLKAMLEAPPAGFSTEGAAASRPVTNITWDKAMGYCRWFAKRQGWEPQSVTLPSQAEFLRALRGRTVRSNPLDPNFWSKCRLGKGGAPGPVKSNPLDKIFLGVGQVYDLVGNAAEWGREAKDARRALLGGDCAQTAPDFNPLASRWAPAEQAGGAISFRIVHLLGK